MEDSSSRKRWWLIVTAAILAVVTLYYYTGSWVIVALFLAAVAALLKFQATRGSRALSHACVRCGAKLNPNARQCDACGSASWTVH